jgi:16S rRNA processing protein RimM
MRKSSDQARQSIHSSGSPQSGEPVYLTIGKLRRTHGVKGEIVLEMTTEFPHQIKSGIKIYIGQDKQEHTLASIRPHGSLFLISIEGFTDCDSVSVFRNMKVCADASLIGSLPEGRFYHNEVIGMHVEDEQGKPIGRVKEILVTGANDVYVIAAPDNSEILIPAIKQVVLSMDRETQKMIVKLQEWD